MAQIMREDESVFLAGEDVVTPQEHETYKKRLEKDKNRLKSLEQQTSSKVVEEEVTTTATTEEGSSTA